MKKRRDSGARPRKEVKTGVVKTAPYKQLNNILKGINLQCIS